MLLHFCYMVLDNLVTRDMPYTCHNTFYPVYITEKMFGGMQKNM